MLQKKLEVLPNYTGLLFRKNVLDSVLPSGVYTFWAWEEVAIVPISQSLRMVRVVNQEVLTADSIALRFSFSLVYKITDAKLFVENFGTGENNLSQAELQLTNSAQLYLREKISALQSEELNEKRNEITDFKEAPLEKEVAALGITLLKAQLVDLTFPKNIQDLFARVLESKIRAKSELENARTAVATARALKNASELMKDDPNIKFFQYLETITKIADKGKHTFVIGEVPQTKL